MSIYKENLLSGKPLGEYRDLVTLMGIRIFINSDPIKKGGQAIERNKIEARNY